MTTTTYGVSEEKYSLGDTTRVSYGIVAYAGSKKTELPILLLR